MAESSTGVRPERVAELAARERELFVSSHRESMARTARGHASMPRGVPMAWMDELYDHPPVWVSHGSGSRFWDVDDNGYLDMYGADMSAFCGHAPPAVTEAVARRAAAGTQYLMPSEDALVVSEHLVERYRMPQWQFTLSATMANTEVVRLARAVTGREVVLAFDGKYHGHLDATLTALGPDDGRVVPEFAGLPREVATSGRVVPFNDLDAVEVALGTRDVAVVITEPAMTNLGFILPEPGFHDGLRALCRDTGTLLCIDETHSLVTSYAGLAGEWGLDCDFYTVGKSIAGGIPLGTYGMTDEVAQVLSRPQHGVAIAGVQQEEVATGGTLFANPLSMAAARAALLEVLTPAAFERTAVLGRRVRDGLVEQFARVGLPWSVVQHGAHAAYFFCPEPPSDGALSRAVDDPVLRELMREHLVNRGVWESGSWLGPTVSVAHTEADVDEYISAMGALVEDLVR